MESERAYYISSCKSLSAGGWGRRWIVEVEVEEAKSASGRVPGARTLEHVSESTINFCGESAAAAIATFTTAHASISRRAGGRN